MKKSLEIEHYSVDLTVYAHLKAKDSDGDNICVTIASVEVEGDIKNLLAEANVTAFAQIKKVVKE